MTDLLTHVKAAISEYGLIEKNDKILVACSGGPDSMALFHVLNELASEYNLRLYLAHINHGIRNEADGDEGFVKNISKLSGVPFVCQRTDVPQLSKEWKLSLEGAARKIRYDFLIQQAHELGVRKVALGHTANDQAETILMRLIRGSGLKGLAGIEPVRRMKGITFIRPLLKVERPAIIQYLSFKKVAYRTDKTNLKRCCTRNKIRLDLIPFIEKGFNPSIISTLSRTSELLREEYRAIEWFLDRQANGEGGDEILKGIKEKEGGAGYIKGIEHKEIRTRPAGEWKQFLLAPFMKNETCQIKLNGFYELDTDEFKTFPIGIQRRVLQRILTLYYGQSDIKGVGFKHIQSIIKLVQGTGCGGPLILPKGVMVYRKVKKLIFRQPRIPKRTDYGKDTKERFEEDTKGAEKIQSHLVKIPGPTFIDYFDLLLEAKIFAKNRIEVSSGPLVAFLDLDAFKNPLQIRTRIAGDRFYPLGMKGRKKLKEFFIDIKIPSRLRNSWPLLVCGTDIVWVLGLRIAHPYRVTPNTKNILELSIR